MESIYKCEYCGFLSPDKNKVMAHEKECLEEVEDGIIEVIDDFYDELEYYAETYSVAVIDSAMKRWVKEKIENYDNHMVDVVFDCFNSDNWDEVEKSVQKALDNLKTCECECEECKKDDFRSKVKSVISEDELQNQRQAVKDFLDSIFD